MYVPINSGMGRYQRRRGFGDVSCPGDPSCPGYVAPGSSDYQTSLLQEILANQTAATATAPAATSTGTLTAWLSANSTLVSAAALGLGLLVFLKAGR